MGESVFVKLFKNKIQSALVMVLGALCLFCLISIASAQYSLEGSAGDLMKEATKLARNISEQQKQPQGIEASPTLIEDVQENVELAMAEAAERDFLLTEQPHLGYAGAPVMMVLFEDFSCPHCKLFNQNVMAQLIRDYVLPGDLYIVFVNYPVINKDSFFAAWAGECAFKQDNVAFWRLKRYMFDIQGATDKWSSPDSIAAIAREYVPELDAEELARCVLEGDFEDEVFTDLAFGQSLELEGTPSMMVNGMKVTGGDYGKLRQIIDIALERTKLN